MKLCYLLPILLTVLLVTVGFVQDSDGDIVAITEVDTEFSTLILGLETTGLDAVLRNSEAEYTVFAPTDDAFASSLDAMGLTLEDLLNDTARLNQILQYHVLGTALDASTIASNADENGSLTLATLEGSEIAATMTEDGLVLNADPVLEDSGINVTATDIRATNGIIHVIDGVLLPQSAPQSTEIATATIRIAHLSPDAPPVDIYINGEVSDIESLAYPDVTGWIELPADTYEIAVVPIDEDLSAAVIGPVDLTFAADTWTTISAVGLFERDELKANVFAENRTQAIPDGQARLTTYHSIGDAPAVDVLANGEVLIPGLAFPGSQNGNDGVFVIDVPAGSYDVEIVPTGATEPVLLSLPATELTAGSYTFVAAIGSLANPDVYVETFTPAQLAGETTMSGATVSILDTALSNPDLSILVAALDAVNLTDVMHSEGDFTVFAPTNIAFAAALDTLGITEADLLADTETLNNILLYHVLDGTQTAEDLSTVIMEAEGEQAVTELEVPTLQGEPVILSLADDELLINGAGVSEADIAASNGVIHVIDAVLLPPSGTVE